jgi:hypothetical protein
LLWSRPQNKRNAGKLLIIGGHSQNLIAPTKAYEIAVTTGIGKATVVMPDSIPKHITTSEDIVIVNSSKSGGIAKNVQNVLLAMSNEVDLALWPGSIGGDSETTRLLEAFLRDAKIPIVLTGDSLNTIIKQSTFLERAKTLAVLTIVQLQNINVKMKSVQPITLDIQLTNLVEILQDLTKNLRIDLATLHNSQLLVASEGKISTTKITEGDHDEFKWRLRFATISAVLWAQFPKQRFAALTTAAWLFKEEDGRY